jgi:single-strand DNA-binding protein
MNSCILMAKIVRRPELRYTQDNQTPYAQMLVEFSPSRTEAAPANLRAVAWGNLASEVAQNYNEGDQVILEGRLSMQMIDRPEGFKEKRAELVISHLYHLDGSMSSGEVATPSKEKVVAIDSYKSKPAPVASVEPVSTGDFEYDASYELSNPSAWQPSETSVEENLDDIPF